ncbi:MAG: protein translocase subunit SecD [Candidatus Riflebacteria bacterium]|nr:protein translocase subunit SecD [Candidatus Riflebacteria bacterium]
MKFKHSTALVISLLIFLVAIAYTLPSLPLWRTSFGSLPKDLQEAVPIQLFSFRNSDPFDANKPVSYVSVTADVQSNYIARAGQDTARGRSENALLSVVSALRNALVDKGYTARIIEFSKDGDIYKKEVMVEGLDALGLEKEIASSKLYAKLPLQLTLLFPTSKITLGLDLKGGVDLLYQVAPVERQTMSETVSSTISVLRNRMDMYGIAEPLIVSQGNDQIRVQLPGVRDIETVKRSVQSTAMLEFYLVDAPAPYATYEEASRFAFGDQKIMHEETEGGRRYYVVPKTPALTGRDLRFAEVGYDQYAKPCVNIRFNDEGAHTFADLTGNNINRPMAIALDGRVYSAPVIQDKITGGQAIISGRFTMDEAKYLAKILQGGALPTTLTLLESTFVGPSLGKQSIEAGFKAGLFGFFLVIVYMVFAYKFLGVVASVAVIFNTLIVFSVLVMFGGTLTMPGIAGLVLSVGMAVDANVVIFERIKEEYKSGKTPRMAVEAGFDRAFACILDSNVTTLLTVIILYLFNSGPIRGFATTLGVGLVSNLYTAVAFTKMILSSWYSNPERKTLSF